MGKLSALALVFEHGGNMILTAYVVKGSRPPFSVQRLMHNISSQIKIKKLQNKTIHLKIENHRRLTRLSLLKAGDLAAHRVHCLMLLGSPPDMVHSSRLRKTHFSTQGKAQNSHQDQPSKKEFAPAIADFRYRAPLPPRIVWPYFTAF